MHIINSWVGIMPGRMSFGFVGALIGVDILPSRRIIRLADLRFTEDVYDSIKLEMSGCKLNELLDFSRPAATWLMAITKQGKLRTMRARGAEFTPTIGAAYFVSPTDGHNRVIIDRLDFTVSVDHEVWRSFFFDGDDEWARTEMCLIENLDQWTKTMSILKTTLCPPICSVSSGK